MNSIDSNEKIEVLKKDIVVPAIVIEKAKDALNNICISEQREKIKNSEDVVE